MTGDEKKARAVQDYRKQYSDALYLAKFVLCPRGFGTSSFRIFESMRCGRVPVIISDDWVEPQGPDWPSFSIRVRESQVSSIPQILSERVSESKAMGSRARKEWEQWFSPSSSFHYLIESILKIKGNLQPTSRRKLISRAFVASFYPKSMKGFLKEVILKKKRW